MDTYSTITELLKLTQTVNALKADAARAAFDIADLKQDILALKEQVSYLQSQTRHDL